VIVVWIVLGVIVLVAIAGVISYNRFVTQKNLIKDAWANIDTELRRRYDLIPNLVETVKGYATHEREVFDEVTARRAEATSAGSVATTRAGGRRSRKPGVKCALTAASSTRPPSASRPRSQSSCRRAAGG